MIQRRAVVLTLLAITAVAACKHGKPAPGPGSADRTGSATPGSGAVGSGTAIATGSGSDLGSAMPKPGEAITRPFFYKVEKDGKTSYLIGTWHVGVDAEKQMPKAVWDAFEHATAFAMEADPADPALLSAARRNDGKTLEQDLGPEYWAKLEALLGPMAKNLNGMKPVAAALMLQFKDLPDTTPMDLAFINKAKAEKKQLAFLEQAQIQIKLLDRWVDDRILRQTIDDLSETKQKIDDALAAYMIGDDATLISMVLDRDGMKEAGFSDAELDQAANEMLYDRNAAWIPVLAELFAKGDAFVAVGAGHLIGPKSVVELLQAKGYAITRIEG